MHSRNACSSVKTGRHSMYILQTVVVCGVVCMCLSSTAGPGWWSGRGVRMSEDQGSTSTRYRGPTALYHEQTVAVVTYNGPGDTVDRCRLILAESNDQFDKIDLLQHLTARMPVEQVTFQTMMSIVQICQDIQIVKEERQPSQGNKTLSDQDPVNYWALTSGILPGTLWCGVNDIAENYYSLGPDWQLDKCCRAHDHCPLKVKPFKTRYGLFNLGPYTKSHCTCDKKFYDCLKKVNNDKSNAIGDFFFNVISVQCVEQRVKRRCVRIAHGVKDHSQLPEQSEQTTKVQERTFNLGLHFGIENVPRKSRCLVWEDEPQDAAKFYIVNAKQKY